MTIALDLPLRSSAANLEKIMNAGLPALLVFETADCAPCRQLEPALKALARHYAGQVLIARIEDSDAALARRFAFERLPALVLWRDGQEAGRLSGAVSESELAAHLEHWLKNGPRPAAASGAGMAVPGLDQGRAAPGQGFDGSRGGQQAPGGRAAPQSSGHTPAASAAASAKPVEGSDAGFQEQVLNSPLPVLVDFWAPWCGPCRMVSPVVEELGREYAGRLRVVKINTDNHPYNAGRLGVQGIPTLMFFKNGREVDRIVGAAPKGMIKQKLERALGL